MDIKEEDCQKLMENGPGNGLWKSDKPEVNAITNNEPIPFTNGRPDFSKWKVGDDLKVDGMTGADSDFPKIYEKMKQEYGFKTQKEAKESRSYSSPFR